VVVSPVTIGELGPHVDNVIPEILYATRIYPVHGSPTNIVQYKQKVFNETDIFYVDSTFFKIFSFPLILGNKDQAHIKPILSVQHIRFIQYAH